MLTMNGRSKLLVMAAGQPLHLFQQPQQHVGGQAALVGLVHHDDAEVWEEELVWKLGLFDASY